MAESLPKCRYCGSIENTVTYIKAATGQREIRCSNCLNQPSDFHANPLREDVSE